MNNLTYNTETAGTIINSCITLDNIFSQDELNEIEFNCNNFNLQSAKITSKGQITESLRKSDVSFVYYNNDAKWIFDKIKNIIVKVNNDFWRFELTGFNYFQYTEYNGSGSKYDWHMDLETDVNTEKLTRKLSLSIILSDSSEYQGGEFEIATSLDSPTIIPQERNRLIAFPSFMYHRVKPLISGKRRSIVVWVLGPKFK